MIPDPFYLQWAFHRIRQGRLSLEGAASRSWELCPAETQTVPSAICLAGETDKIRGYSPWTSAEEEAVSIRGGRISHAASRAFLLETARVAGPVISCGGFKAAYGYGSEAKFIDTRTPVHVLPRAHLAASWAGSLFFGPFLRDLTVEMIPEEGAPVIGLTTRAYAHEAEYRALLGLPRPDRVVRGRVGELVVYQDFAQNSFKAARYRTLRARLRNALGPVAAAPGVYLPGVYVPGVYLRRGTGGEARVLVNETAVEQRLAGLGFDILDPATMSAGDLARRCLDAPIVVSVEGSHVSHAIYPIAETGTMVVLQPPDRFSTVHKQVADRLGMGFAFHVCAPAEGGFTADTDALLRLLDRIACRHA